jgi:adenylate cyclase
VLEALRVEARGTGYRAIVEQSPTGFAIGMEPGISRVIIEGARISVPTDTDGRLRLYYGGPETRRSVSAWKLLADDVNRPSLIGKIAVIGISVNGAEHLYKTPIGVDLASGAIAANAIDQIFDGAYLTRPGWAPAAEQVFILLGGLLVVIAISRFRFRWGFAVALLLTGAAAYGSWYLFQTHRWVVDPALPGVTLLIAAVTCALMRRLHTEDITRFIEAQFSRRLSSAGLARVRANPSMIQGEGELKDITSVVVGLRGFNIIADRYLEDPTAYADILNRFFTPMVKIVQDRNGMADRSVGDTLFAVWNAPISVSDHATKGCDAALRMVENLEALNEFLEEDARRQNLSHVPLSLSIGVDTGTAITGNMGAIQRFDYGVLGEPVSFAAYLQKNARNYGPAIIVGEGAQRVVGSRFALLEIDLIATPRHPEGRRVFALLGDPIMRANPKFRALQEAHTMIFAAYRNQRWDEARAAIAETRKLNGAISTLYDFYETRISGYELNPPGPHWNGTWFAGRL